MTNVNDDHIPHRTRSPATHRAPAGNEFRGDAATSWAEKFQRNCFLTTKARVLMFRRLFSTDAERDGATESEFSVANLRTLPDRYP
ncbi:unnamed protein product [Nippostrongylus brasiliensis]|uniref:DUF1534 domain-containing protein n=1 Tax=Nippostrongylus brasiliensis TaxID=27835 RepID=A0A0N4Y6N5_NIPBR|nr:unnamed protein product [Nippostrongylus brasiliensis]